jgi:hypothetical protein
MNPGWLWIGFAVGLLARYYDRGSFIVNEEVERTWKEYLKLNAVKIAIRVAVNAFLFHLILQSGEVQTELQAFTCGITFEVVAESFMDRARRAIVKRQENGNAKPNS